VAHGPSSKTMRLGSEHWAILNLQLFEYVLPLFPHTGLKIAKHITPFTTVSQKVVGAEVVGAEVVGAESVVGTEIPDAVGSETLA